MENDQLYIFRISVDVRNFRALRRLPLPVASIFVKVTFPAEVVQLAVENTSKQAGANVAALTAPLRTHPPAEVARQTEVALTNGFAALELPATIMAMATALARGAKLVAEVYHRDRYTADRLLGVGSVPMAALLEEPWLDGYVPILANKRLPGKQNSGPVTERVAVGSLRMVLVIEELGLAMGPGRVKRRTEAAIRPEVPPSVAGDLPWPETQDGIELPEYAESTYAAETEERQSSAAWVAPPSTPSEGAGRREAEKGGEPERNSAGGNKNQAEKGGAPERGHSNGGGRDEEVEIREEEVGEPNQGEEQTRETTAAPEGQVMMGEENETLEDVNTSRSVNAGGLEADASRDGGGGEAKEEKMSQGMRTPGSIRGGAEYEAAWELEVWKQSEEAKFKAELKERETARMAALEQEWRKREKESVAETEALRAEHAALGAKLHEQLASLELREKKLVGAEEAASNRREALEREHAQRTADIKAAIKRLKEECEHQLKLERSRFEELAKQKKGLEERLASAEAARAKLEREFSDFRAAQRGTPEAELMAQVVALQQKSLELQRGAEKATTAKKQYKAQVLRMARELAAMHRQQAADEAARLAKERRRLEARALASTAKEEADRAREEQTELRALKEQLARLQEQEQASAAATAAALRALSLDRVVSEDESDPPRRVGPRKKKKSGPADPSEIPRQKKPAPTALQREESDALEAAEAKLRQAHDPMPERSLKDGDAAEAEDRKSQIAVGEFKASNEDVVRLLRERAALLRTGVYQRADKVIVALEKEIQRRSAASQTGDFD